jgi:hypothetical protein
LCSTGEDTKSSKDHWDHGKGSALCGTFFLW